MMATGEQSASTRPGSAWCSRSRASSSRVPVARRRAVHRIAQPPRAAAAPDRALRFRRPTSAGDAARAALSPILARSSREFLGLATPTTSSPAARSSPERSSLYVPEGRPDHCRRLSPTSCRAAAAGATPRARCSAGYRARELDAGRSVSTSPRRRPGPGTTRRPPSSIGCSATAASPIGLLTNRRSSASCYAPHGESSGLHHLPRRRHGRGRRPADPRRAS